MENINQRLAPNNRSDCNTTVQPENLELFHTIEVRHTAQSNTAPSASTTNDVNTADATMSFSPSPPMRYSIPNPTVRGAPTALNEGIELPSQSDLFKLIDEVESLDIALHHQCRALRLAKEEGSQPIRSFLECQRPELQNDPVSSASVQKAALSAQLERKKAELDTLRRRLDAVLESPSLAIQSDSTAGAEPDTVDSSSTPTQHDPVWFPDYYPTANAVPSVLSSLEQWHCPAENYARPQPTYRSDWRREETPIFGQRRSANARRQISDSTSRATEVQSEHDMIRRVEDMSLSETALHIAERQLCEETEHLSHLENTLRSSSLVRSVRLAAQRNRMRTTAARVTALSADIYRKNAALSALLPSATRTRSTNLQTQSCSITNETISFSTQSCSTSDPLSSTLSSHHAEDENNAGLQLQTPQHSLEGSNTGPVEGRRRALEDNRSGHDLDNGQEGRNVGLVDRRRLAFEQILSSDGTSCGQESTEVGLVERMGNAFEQNLAIHGGKEGLESDKQRNDSEKQVNICIFCLDPLKSLRALALPCGHAFHAECLTRWMRIKKECPTCKRPVRWGEGTP